MPPTVFMVRACIAALYILAASSAVTSIHHVLNSKDLSCAESGSCTGNVENVDNVDIVDNANSGDSIDDISYWW